MESLAVAAIGYIISSVKSSKGGKAASDEMSNAIWNWIKPIFIKEDKELINQFEKNPEDKDMQTEMKLRIKRKAKNDSEFASQLSTLIERAQDAGETPTEITVNQYNIHGDNIGRDKIIRSDD
ncbi:MAG: hypothetical protein MI974_31795 [Chitinophagales bacterium]|nr:hypothetical protein [Chitinophagales bacterium]